MSDKNYSHINFEGVGSPFHKKAVADYSWPSPASIENERAYLSSEEVRLVDFIFAKAALDPKDYRHGPLKRRISACLRILKVSNCDAALRLLAQGDDSLHVRALGALLIGTTQLYRDAEVFNYLRKKFLPSYSKDRKKLKVLSLACSDGAELYTMAAILEELSLLTNSFLVGVDVRPSAIEAARKGVFSVQHISEMPDDLRDLYFSSSKNQYFSNAKFVSKLQWDVANVLGSKFLREKWDIILCRNVAIYLAPKICDSLWADINSALYDGGVLVSGKAERPRQLNRIATCIFEKAGEKNDRGGSI